MPRMMEQPLDILLRRVTKLVNLEHEQAEETATGQVAEACHKVGHHHAHVVTLEKAQADDAATGQAAEACHKVRHHPAHGLVAQVR